MADPRREPVRPIAVRDLPDRGRVVCHGFIESVTYMPAVRVAAFTAMVVDHEPDVPRSKQTAAAARNGQPLSAAGIPAGAAGVVPEAKDRAGARQRTSRPSGRLRVIWLGRRRIPGIVAGTELQLQGMVTVRDGQPTMFNPRYEIVSGQEDQ